MARKLFIRFSTSADFQAVSDFYDESQYLLIARRDPQVWRDRLAAGAGTIIHDSEGRIVASSISYPVMEQVNDENVHMWTEIGSTRVSMEGIGLFRPLVSAQVLRACLFEPPEDRFIIKIPAANEHSRHVFLKAGALPYIPPGSPEDFLKKFSAGLPDYDPSIKRLWLQMDAGAVPALARGLLEKMDHPRIVNKQTGEEFDLDFSQCVLATACRDVLEDIARKYPCNIQNLDSLGNGNPRNIGLSTDKFQP